MAKNQGTSNRQAAHRRFSSYNGEPPLDNRFSSVPLWEKKFCATEGSVPWRSLQEGKTYMESHSNVMKWDDYAVKQAVYDAKFRFWAKINGYRCDIPSPDPDMYIDDVDWDVSVDPQLYLDLEREVEARRNMIIKRELAVILGIEGIEPTGWGDREAEARRNMIIRRELALILGIEGIEPTGFGDDEEEVTKPQEPSYLAEEWRSNNRENNETNSWEQNHENNETNSWEQNDSQRWVPKEQYVVDLQNKHQARNHGYDRRKNNSIVIMSTEEEEMEEEEDGGETETILMRPR